MKRAYDAIRACDIPAIRQLLLEPDILAKLNDPVDIDKQTLLHLAVLHDRTGVIVKLLLQNQADVNVVNDGLDTPLMLAVRNDRKIAYRHLIKAGTNLNIINIHGYTVLDMAIYYRIPELVDLIREATKRQTISVPFANFQDGFSLIKATGHITGVRSKIRIPSPLRGEITISTEKNYTHLSFKSLNDFFQQYVFDTEIKRTAEEQKCLVDILEAYGVTNNFVNLENSVTEVVLLKRYQENKIIILPVCMNVINVAGKIEKHVVGIGLYGKFFVYCNRGGGSRQEVRIYEMTEEERKHIDEAWIRGFFPFGRIPEEQEIHKLIVGRVASFGATKTDAKHFYECAAKPQKHATCTMANLKILRFPLLLLQELKKSQEFVGGIISPAMITIALLNAKHCYKESTCHMRDKFIDMLLEKLRVAREKREKDPIYKLCLRLIFEILKEHHGQNPSSIRPERIKRMEKVKTESKRALKMLKALTKAERNRVMNAQKSKIKSHLRVLLEMDENSEKGSENEIELKVELEARAPMFPSLASKGPVDETHVELERKIEKENLRPEESPRKTVKLPNIMAMVEQGRCVRVQRGRGVPRASKQVPIDGFQGGPLLTRYRGILTENNGNRMIDRLPVRRETLSVQSVNVALSRTAPLKTVG